MNINQTNLNSGSVHNFVVKEDEVRLNTAIEVIRFLWDHYEVKALLAGDNNMVEQIKDLLGEK